MEFIDFSVGQTEEFFFASDAMRNAACSVLNHASKYAFQYAPEMGLETLRLELSNFLSLMTNQPVKMENLFITNGASHALELILKKLIPVGSSVAVEDPTYFLSLNILNDWDINLVPIPMTQDGLDVDFLEEQIPEHDIKLLYTIPFHHNPTGVVMSSEKCRRLKELACRHNMLVASDEVYQFVGDVPFAGLYSAGHENIISIGSFSKILAPGVRLGWIHASESIICRLLSCGVVISGGGVSPIMSLLVANLISTGTQLSILHQLNQMYSRRRCLMNSILSESLPTGIEFTPPAGGFFCWLKLPHSLSSYNILEIARKENIAFKLGPEFSSCGHFDDCLRLAFTYFDENIIENGCKRLVRIFDDALLHCGVDKHDK